ncbi:MAG: hypothetical protein GXP25_02825 [Planctomycetes bacterium]|nr:hypothetical protein [Planctomycetota bacterium]
MITQERYSRLKAIWGAPNLSCLRSKTVMVIGCGNLGGQIIPHLAMLGVGMVLVDHDRVKAPNLGNQAFDVAHMEKSKVSGREEQVKRINPECRIETLDARVEALGMGVFRDVDMVFCCLDNLASRLWVNEACLRLSVPWVDAALDGSGKTTYAKVACFPNTDGSACYLCSWDADALQGTLRTENGGCKSWWDIGNEDAPPTLSSSCQAAVAAGIQCVAGLRMLLGDGEADSSHEIIVNPEAGFMRRVCLKANVESCIAPHEPFMDVARAGAGRALSVNDLFSLAERKLGPGVELVLHGRDLLTTVDCAACQKGNGIWRMTNNSAKSKMTCLCGAPLTPTPLSVLRQMDRGAVTPILTHTWAELGLPRKDIVTAKKNGASVHFLIE